MNPLRLALVLLPVLLTACAISPGPQTAPELFCRMEPIQLDVDAEGEPTLGGPNLPDPGTLGGRILETYRDSERPGPPPAATEEPVSGSIILLSGGGEDGAFGAGFLDGWAAARRPHGLPRARIVTGISTGAILSTFAFIDEPERLARNYAIQREEDILQPYSDSRDELGLAVTAVRRGAVADLSPLRRLLLANVDEAAMARIEQERDAGRSLYVGAVDMDSGQAVAFDLTALAERYWAAKRGRSEEDPERIRECYVDAIIASSSVPMAAPPVFIDNRMYIDGGARFGVFTHEFEQVTARLAAARAGTGRGGRPRFLYAVMNSDMVTAPQCRTADAALCPPEDPNAGRHRDWTLPGLAGRSLSVLINQIYRFSAARLHDIADREDFGARVEYIRPDMSSHVYPAGSGTTCPQAREEDERVDRPVEFHRRFMHCLIDYGRMRAGRSGWAALEPVP
ncbi:MAG: patatin-like phospholipase family protein [Allosphingosinicella sp.]